MFVANIVASVLVAIAVALVLRLVRYYRGWATVLAPISQVQPSHWFWGLLKAVTNSEQYYKVILNDMYAAKCQHHMSYYWNAFLFPSVALSHPGSLKAILSATDVPKNRGHEGIYRMFQPWIGDGVLCSNGRKWERNRRLLTPAFHFDILKQYVAVVHDVADIFLDKLSTLSKTGTSVDIYPHVSKATLDTVLRCALSYTNRNVQLEEGDRHPYVKAIQRLSCLAISRFLNPVNHYDWIYNLRSEGREFKKHCDFVHEFSSNIIKQRKRALELDASQIDKRRLDFLDILLTAKDESGMGLTDTEIRDEVDTFMFAGHDTTASGVSWAIYHLAKYPDMQQRVREEVGDLLNGHKMLMEEDLRKLTYTACFIKESMRMYPPVPGLARKLNRPLTIEGVTFPTGTVFDLGLYPMHHNETVWKDNWEFRPERFFLENIKDKDAFAFLPFSAGQRYRKGLRFNPFNTKNCIGQNFALNELKVLITRLVTRFEVTLDPERKAEPFPELVMRSKDGIHIKFKEI